MRILVAGAAVLAACAAPAHALDPRLVPDFGADAQPTPSLDLALRHADPASGDASPPGTLSPVLAGLMSAVVPGSAQLAMGADRGWLYLGIEAAGWFGWWALRSSGDQASDDAYAYADGSWDIDRYAGDPAGCGVPGAGTNFDQNYAVIQEQRAAGGEDYYNSLEDVTYACGWESQGSRDTYLGMKDDADGLYSAARGFTAALFLNHIVSAIDAARTASTRRKAAAAQSMNLKFHPAAGGDLAVRFEMKRSF